ncbi:hypothetical protein, partial [Legionella sp.]|uniref:hypothetical protein n=1 Tax=Legionella sp. TaxID=459 RepID=UPI003C8158B1
KFLSVSSFSEPDNYLSLVQTIETQASINPEYKKVFYESFGLNVENFAIENVNKIQNINTQHENNESLLEIVKHPDKYPGVSTKLVGFLLRLEKHAEIDVNNNPTLEYLKIQDPSDIEVKIELLFKKSRTAKEFINLYIRPQISHGSLTQKQKQFRDELVRELTPELFREIKNEILSRVFAGTPEMMNSELNKIEKALAEIQQNHKQFDKHMGKLAYILDMNDIHVYNPVFQSKASKMRIKYKEISEECDLIIDQLRYDRQRLNDYLDNIPLPPERDGVLGQKEVIERVKELHRNLQKQINKIDRQLEFYEDVNAKIMNTILPSIAVGTKNPQKYAYEPESVVTYLIERDKEKEEALKSRSSFENLENDIQIEYDLGKPSKEKEQLAKFVLEDEPRPNQVRCFDVTYKTPSNDINVKGRFIYDKVNPGAFGATAKGNKVYGPDPGKYIIRKFPMPEEGVTAEELRAARVNFAMTVATQVLTGMDAPPSKDNPIRLRNGTVEELQYIWTAFAILGETIPKMKFGTDALFVTSNKFDAKTQKGLWGYTSESLYKKSFAESSAAVKVFVEDLKTHTNERYDNTGVRKRETKAKDATQFFKDELIATKKATEERQKNQGVSAEPPSATYKPTEFKK